MIMNVLKNPRTRKMVGSAIKQGAVMIRDRRQGRINRGEKVWGQRIRDRRIRRGRPVPLHPNAAVSQQIPVRLATIDKVQQVDDSSNLKKVESSKLLLGVTTDITSHGVVYYEGQSNILIYPLNPMDATLFPTAFARASGYGYYTWESFSCSYEPTCAVDEAGIVGIAYTPDFATAMAVDSWDSFCALPMSTRGQVFARLGLSTGKKALNPQFPEFKNILPKDLNYYDSSCNQGFLLVAVSSCDVATQLGRLTFGYSVTFRKAKIPENPDAEGDFFLYNDAAHANVAYQAISNPYPAAHYANPPWTATDSGGGVCLVEGHVRSAYWVSVDVKGAAFPTLAFAAVSGCELLTLCAEVSTDATLRTYYLLIRPSDTPHTFTITQTNNATHTYIFMHTIRRSTVDAIYAMVP